MKGAPETVLGMCAEGIYDQGQRYELSEDHRGQVLETIASLASQPLRMMSFGFAIINLNEWEAQYENKQQSTEAILENNITSRKVPFCYIGSFGLKDPLRQKV